MYHLCKEKDNRGFTLIELVLVLMLSSLLVGAMVISTRKLEEVKFNIFIEQVERGITTAQHMATLTGTSYTVYCAANSVYVHKGGKKVYKFPMDRGIILVDDETTLKEVTFRGKMISSAGSMVFAHTGLGQKATLTLRVATGKTTLYKAQYNP